MDTILSTVPPLCFVALQLSSLNTMKKILYTGTTGGLSPVPFVSLFTNCVIWLLFGMLKGDPTVLLPNLSGMVFGLAYTVIFYKYAATDMRRPLLLSASVVALALGIVATLEPDVAASRVGSLGCLLAVIVMASPLAVMRAVIRDKSTALMAFPLSLATFMNALSWFLYGYVIADEVLIWGPNALGLAFACVQLSLFARYGIHSPSSPASSPKTVQSAASPKECASLINAA